MRRLPIVSTDEHAIFELNIEAGTIERFRCDAALVFYRTRVVGENTMHSFHERNARLIVDSMPEGVLVWTASGQVSDCNGMAERLLAKSRGELIGLTSDGIRHDFVDAEGCPARFTQGTVARALGEGVSSNVEVGVRCGGGPQLWLRKTSRPLRSASGSIVGAVTTLVDITELHNESQHLAEVIAGANVGTWELDLETNVARRSPVWFELLGRSPEGFSSSFEDLKSIVHPDDVGELSTIPERWSSGLPYSVELRFRTASGDWKWFQIRGRARLGADGKAVKAFGVLVSIDARKKVEASLQSALAENLRLVDELRAALGKISQLEGLLPICLSCKSIHDGENWIKLEAYISERSTARFSHGICPVCFAGQL